MSVTKILFKQGSTTPSGSSFASTVGEPLWCTGTNTLYVTNGTNSPTLIGPATPYSHPTFTISTGTGYTVTPGTGQDATDQIVAASTGYAIGGFTVTAEGHIKAVTAVQLPSAGTTVSGSNDGTYWTDITIGNDTYDIPFAVTGTEDGTNWTSLTIGSVTRAIPQASGGSAVNDEIIAVAGTAVTIDGQNYTTAKIKNNGASNEVTFKSDVPQSGAGSVISFTAGGSGTALDITAKVEVICGGTW